MIDPRRVVVAFMLVALRACRSRPGSSGTGRWRPAQPPGTRSAERLGSGAERPWRAVAAAGRRRHRAQHRYCRAASSPTRRPPERCRCSINRASARPRCSTPPMWPRSRQSDNRAGPLTFVFNGGPGAASAFLNLGLVGPRIAEFGIGATTAPTSASVDNPDTWLAFTDLVLIDPVGTGWSRPAKPDGGSAFWGVRARRRVDGQGDRALRRQEQPRQLAEIHPRRELRRLPRRQGRARRAERAGHRRSPAF